MKTIDYEGLIQKIDFDIHCYNCAISDKNFILPEKTEVEKIIKQLFIKDYRGIINKFDCDDYCLILNAFIKQEHYVNSNKYSWCFGECFGIFGFNEHAMNLVLCADEIFYLIEPQTNEMRRLVKGDNIQWLRI